ncbi:hypothetical protein PGC34_20035 [Pseudomonas kribbensis]|uniref:hypothetical protein n=1 Tax=Pseudomonas kribbensis TaxID=1628086 RepID=UPI003BF89D33
MYTFDVRHETVMFRVGGRLYRLANFSPTCVRLQDLLDGQCLTFSQAEALQMIVQQDLIVLRPSSLQAWRDKDSRESPSSLGQTQGRALEQLIAATGPRRQRARPLAERRRDAPPSGPRGNGAGNTDLCHCTQKLEQMQAHWPRRGYPATPPVQSITLDEVQYYLNTSAEQTRYRTLRRILEQAWRLCGDGGGIGYCKASEQHRLAARRSLLVDHSPRTDSDASPASLARQPQGAALEHAGGRWATTAHEPNSAPNAEVDDVE